MNVIFASCVVFVYNLVSFCKSKSSTEFLSSLRTLCLRKFFVCKTAVFVNLFPVGTRNSLNLFVCGCYSTFPTFSSAFKTFSQVFPTTVRPPEHFFPLSFCLHSPGGGWFLSVVPSSSLNV